MSKSGRHVPIRVAVRTVLGIAALSASAAAFSQKDIADFPELILAESIQGMPGVSIARDAAPVHAIAAGMPATIPIWARTRAGCRR